MARKISVKNESRARRFRTNNVFWPKGHIVLINHRGLSPGLPENTLAAFKHSLALGIDVIELDLRGTKDHIPVVMHDPTVDRTTNGTGAVEGYTLKELKTLDAGSHVHRRFTEERVPTYEEVLKLVSGKDVKLLLDIKPSQALTPRRVVHLTKKFRAESKVIVGARTLENVGLYRSLSRKISVLGFVKNRKDINSFIRAGAQIIRLWPRWIETAPALIRKIQKSGHLVWVTADDADRRDLLKLIRLGVDGILSDRPALLARLLRRVDGGDIKG